MTLSRNLTTDVRTLQKKGHLFIAGVSKTETSSMEAPLESYKQTFCDSAMPLLGICERTLHHNTETCTSMSTAAPCTIAAKWT